MERCVWAVGSPGAEIMTEQFLAQEVRQDKLKGRRQSLYRPCNVPNRTYSVWKRLGGHEINDKKNKTGTPGFNPELCGMDEIYGKASFIFWPPIPHMPYEV